MRALILAAGLGERLRPVTLARAKPAVEFLNMPMLAFPYHWLSTLGLTDVTFNTHHLPDSIRHAAMHVVDPETALHFTHEDHILGSGGGIWNARFNLRGGGHFAVANGDGVVLSANRGLLRDLARDHADRNALATLLVCPLAGVGERLPGVWVAADGAIRRFGKGAFTDSQCLHYASYMIFADRLLDRLPEGPSNILYDVLTQAIAEGEPVRAHVATDLLWLETGNPAEFLAATRICLRHLESRDPLGIALWDLLGRFARHSDLRGSYLIDRRATVAPDAKLLGFGVIGADVQVGAGCVIENSVLLPGAHLSDGRECRNTLLAV